MTNKQTKQAIELFTSLNLDSTSMPKIKTHLKVELSRKQQDKPYWNTHNILDLISWYLLETMSR